MEVDEAGNIIAGVVSDEDDAAFQDANEDPTMVVTINCPEQGCTAGANDAVWSYTGEPSIAAVMLEHHLRSHVQPDRRPRPPQLQPPRLTGQCSEAKFEDFKKLWGFYKNSVEMPDGTVTSYLLNCLDIGLKTDVHAANADILNMSEEQVMAAIRQ